MNELAKMELLHPFEREKKESRDELFKERFTYPFSKVRTTTSFVEQFVGSVEEELLLVLEVE